MRLREIKCSDGAGDTELPEKKRALYRPQRGRSQVKERRSRRFAVPCLIMLERTFGSQMTKTDACSCVQVGFLLRVQLAKQGPRGSGNR
jgi:hypothetical protein